MKFLSFLLFCVVLSQVFAEKCDICKSSVKSIKDGKGLEYMANLSQQQIEDYVTKNVKKHCLTGSECSKLIKNLVEIADQLDDDLDASPEQLCQFVYFC